MPDFLPVSETRLLVMLAGLTPTLFLIAVEVVLHFVERRDDGSDPDAAPYDWKTQGL